MNRLRREAQGFFLVGLVEGAEALDHPKPLAQCLVKDIGLGPPGASGPNADISHQVLVDGKRRLDPSCHIAIMPSPSRPQVGPNRLAPEDGGRVIVDLGERGREIMSGLEKVVEVPLAVTVTSIKSPSLVLVPELSDR